MTDRTENVKRAISSIEALKSYYDSKAKPRRPLKAIRWALCVAKECMEKQVAKKPIKVKGECYMKDKKGNEHYQTKYLCPVCRKQLLYCGYPCKCGQLIDYNDLSKIDWEEGGTSD